jgi:transposase-like protein
MNATPLSDAIAQTRLTIQEVAKRAGVDASTVWRWVLKGVRGTKLESVRVGGRRYVSPMAVESFFAALNSPQQGGTADPVPARTARAEEDARRLGL